MPDDTRQRVESFRKTPGSAVPDSDPRGTGRGGGTTRDVSLSGVFFETGQPFAPGEQVSLVIVLERASPDRPIRLQCEGRVDQSDKRIGVAVAISGYKFGSTGRTAGFV